MNETQTQQTANMEISKACRSCLVRPRLLDLLGAFIEGTINDNQDDIRRLLALDDDALLQATSPRHNDLINEAKRYVDNSFDEVLTESEIWAVCQHNIDYPETLKTLPDPPAVIFGNGDIEHLKWLTRAGSVSIVGTKRATSYGLEVARSLSHELAASGTVVVSGMALGIDGAAHRGALESGMTVAVMPGGSDRAYPVSHTRLFRKVAEDGLVISEMPPGARAWRWCFPARNRIIAALSHTTVVVEAAARSGSLITAADAKKLGRKVGAVPGLVTSSTAGGTNELIANGAQLVRDATDVL